VGSQDGTDPWGCPTPSRRLKGRFD
jgi:hypothetical protein